ncbi:hypothetical protein ACFQ46_04150 [Kineococcus sp. GCM10028916]|uniref:hypothetical protein n=1 Tax=Kineococcus sp. GCM10028916 TaxID=3273394 RepID=UPI00362619E8
MNSATTARNPAIVVVGGAALALLAACSTGGGAATTPTTPSSSSSTAAASPTATAPTSTAPTPMTMTPMSPETPVDAAPAASSGVPAGAGAATTVDLDGDGAPDTLWLAQVDGKRELGVVTTSHGATSVEFTSAAPQSATASAAVLASGAPVVFLDTGRSVQLFDYRVEGPALVPVNGVAGGQYSFSLGFTDYGTGLTCEQQADGLHLFGENATSGTGGTWTVERTEVTVSAEHSIAENGAKTTVATGLAQDDPRVQAAHGTTCGDVTTAQVALEPA